MKSISNWSLFKKSSPLPFIIFLGLFVLVASCSTKGSMPPIQPYPEQVGKQKKSRDRDFSYRKDRLYPNGTKKEATTNPEKELETFTGPETLADLKGFSDDLDTTSLKKAIENQLQAMFEQEPSTPVRLGTFTLTRGRLVDTLEAFLDILKRDLPLEEFNKKIAEDFVLYRVGKGKGKSKKMLFTGYYRPVIQASPVRSALYRFPIYRMPEPDFHQVKYKKGIQLVGTNSGIKKVRQSNAEKTWRRLTREEIDRKGALQGQGLEVGWLKDDLERFFLHIQGSGVLEFPDGSRQSVGYQGSNQYSYTGIGKLMIKDGIIDISQGSMQGIKKYFVDNPQDIAKYLYQNKRYIFFTLSDEGARGSGGGELVGGRSIATDKSIYPAGGLAFIKVKKPVLDENNKIVRWQPISRFVVDQDTGSAIRGPGRGDLYFGTGIKAGAKAGRYHQRGEVYYLIKRS
jgi:membrane-bound lytic murein transglycosylase A